MPYPDARDCTRVLKGRINGRLAKDIHHEGWEQLVGDGAYCTENGWK